MGGERAAAIVAVGAEVADNVEETATLLNAFLQDSLAENGSLYRVDASSPEPAVGGGNS